MAKKAKKTAKKTTAKKTTVKKVAAKKPVAKKKTVKKAASKKVSSKKSVAKKTAAKKTATKKASAKKPVAKKAVSKKVIVKKQAPQKAVSKKSVAAKIEKITLPPVIQMAHDLPPALPLPEHHALLPEPGIIPIDVQIEKVVKNEDPIRLFDRHAFKKATTRTDPRHNMPISSKPKRSKMPSAKKPLWRK